MVPCSTHTVTTSSEICPEKDEVGKNILFDFVIVCCILFESKKNVITSRISFQALVKDVV